ncbi:MAG: hypothetical protein HUK22_08065, partial [Thermoguttaceae bacterium]|nr:hypothetical protein [Thermoguttaceae bacterium]
MAKTQKNAPVRHEHWGSQLGVILAVAGSAVGLGNFLRFPGQVARYGGGAFMIPYFFSLLVVAIPIAWSEWALGRAGGRAGFHSTMGIYHAIGRKRGWAAVGALMTIAPMVLSMYYIFIESWCLLYAVQYLGGTLHSIGLGGFSILPNIAAGFNIEGAGGYAEYF